MRLLSFVVGALAGPLLAWATIATAADADRPRQVLLLYAESRLLPGLVEADAGFRSTVASSLGAPVDTGIGVKEGDLEHIFKPFVTTLGGMSGFDLHQHLATAGGPIPAIFITAHDDPVTRERARSGVAYLQKPFREAALIGAIQQALENRSA